MYQVIIKINRINLPPRYQPVQNHLTEPQAYRLAKKIIKHQIAVLVIKNNTPLKQNKYFVCFV